MTTPKHWRVFVVGNGFRRRVAILPAGAFDHPDSMPYDCGDRHGLATHTVFSTAVAVLYGDWEVT